MKLFHWTADPSSMKKQEMFPFPIELLGFNEKCCECGEGRKARRRGECLLLHLLGEPVEGVRVDRVDLVVVQGQPGHLPTDPLSFANILGLGKKSTTKAKLTRESKDQLKHCMVFTI